MPNKRPNTSQARVLVNPEEVGDSFLAEGIEEENSGVSVPATLIQDDLSSHVVGDVSVPRINDSDAVDIVPEVIQDHVDEESSNHKANGSDAVEIVPEIEPDHDAEEWLNFGPEKGFQLCNDAMGSLYPREVSHTFRYDLASMLSPRLKLLCK